MRALPILWKRRASPGNVAALLSPTRSYRSTAVFSEASDLRDDVVITDETETDENANANGWAAV